MYSPSFPGLTPFILPLCAVLTSCHAPPWERDRWCELGAYICLYTACRVDLVVRNTFIVHRQQLGRSSWGLNAKNCGGLYESSVLSPAVTARDSQQLCLPPGVVGIVHLYSGPSAFSSGLHATGVLFLMVPCLHRACCQRRVLAGTMSPSALEEKEHEGHHVRNTDCPAQGLKPWFIVQSVAGGDSQHTWGGGEISEVTNI